MLSRPSQGLLLLAALTAGVISTSSPAVAASIETAPCAKLASGEVKFAAGNASRVVFVTAPERKQSSVLITGCVKASGSYVQEWQTTGFIGEKGFAPAGELREREYRSPTGSFSVTEALGLSDPGTALAYHTVNPNSRWGGPGSASYNQYLEGGSPSDENLWYWAHQGTYRQAAVINYNRPPDSATVPGNDYAIFFGAGNTVSAGCVSTDLETSTRVVKTFVPGDRIIMGVDGDVFAPAAPKPTVQSPSNAPESSTAAAAPTVPGVEAGSKPDRTTQTDVESTTKIVAVAVLVLVTLLPLLAYRDKKKRARHRA